MPLVGRDRNEADFFNYFLSVFGQVKGDELEEGAPEFWINRLGSGLHIEHLIDSHRNPIVCSMDYGETFTSKYSEWGLSFDEPRN